MNDFQQGVRNAIAGYEARRNGRSPTLDELVDALGPASKQDVLAALAALRERQFVHEVHGSWRSRAPATRSRAVEAMATLSRLHMNQN